MCYDGKWGGSFACGEAVSSRREGSDKDLEGTLLKPAPSWTVLDTFLSSRVFHTVMVRTSDRSFVRTLNVKWLQI